LIGIPVRLTIGERGLKEGKVELKQRTAEKPEVIRLESAVKAVLEATRQPHA
jgi:prolyl-tRNA synthetase